MQIIRNELKEKQTTATRTVTHKQNNSNHHNLATARRSIHPSQLCFDRAHKLLSMVRKNKKNEFGSFLFRMKTETIHLSRTHSIPCGRKDFFFSRSLYLWNTCIEFFLFSFILLPIVREKIRMQIFETKTSK